MSEWQPLQIPDWMVKDENEQYEILPVNTKVDEPNKINVTDMVEF